MPVPTPAKCSAAPFGPLAAPLSSTKAVASTKRRPLVPPATRRERSHPVSPSGRPITAVAITEKTSAPRNSGTRQEAGALPASSTPTR